MGLWTKKLQHWEVQFFWTSSIDLGYRRGEYMDKIIDYAGNRLIKVLAGQRREKLYPAAGCKTIDR